MRGNRPVFKELNWQNHGFFGLALGSGFIIGLTHHYSILAPLQLAGFGLLLHAQRRFAPSWSLALRGGFVCGSIYAILRIFARDLGLPVGALQHLERGADPAHVAAAIQCVMNYLADENPAFLTYRFGQREGKAMQRGLRELQALASWAAGRGYRLQVTPVRRYRLPDGGREIIERSPGQAHLW